MARYSRPHSLRVNKACTAPPPPPPPRHTPGQATLAPCPAHSSRKTYSLHLAPRPPRPALPQASHGAPSGPSKARRSHQPWVLKLHEGEGRAAAVLQIYEDDFPEFVEQVLNILGPDVRGQVPHVYAALVVASAVRHGWSGGNVRWTLLSSRTTMASLPPVLPGAARPAPRRGGGPCSWVHEIGNLCIVY